jgi:mannose-6-phosphate isomerase-like protein (cupin superfamily)
MRARSSAWLLACLLGAGTPGIAAPMYANLKGEALLDNERVFAQKFLVQPGQSTGVHTYAGDELLVFIKGGVLKSDATGRAVLWKDGRVVFHSASTLVDQGSTNTGSEPIEMIAVTLKPVAPGAGAPAGSAPKYRHLDYPNIPGEDLLENELVIVQRFVIEPGQWEGVHAHHPDMLYIHVKGGQWASRSKNQPPRPYPQPAADGSVGWMPAVPLSEEHQSGNVGSSPIDLIWVTLKK